ncbi:MAG: 4-hydroxythreonine-4-phosphate dehydrogenase PdxA, partial [Proteobacteria bacterium]|nr:4-hydroxythreonine-4-phosphate dehydrogenase PdxA [Burkholderiales bacterium]
MPTIAVTAGEPAGIGPDLCVALAAEPPPGARIVVIADPALLLARASTLGARLEVIEWQADRGSELPPPGTLLVAPVALTASVEPGRLDPANARYVLESIGRAVRGCCAHEFDALVTAPVHKGVINDAGLPFTGHTELLAELTGTPQVVMMLVGGGLRVALATTHLPLSAVPEAIEVNTLTRTLTILDHALRREFGIARPRILVAGLNPHAGEGGHLGREEIDVIAPVIAALHAAGMDVRGPLPADTLFNPERLRECDAVLAMYHDQGLPVLKYASFGAGVNVTLGLPIVRTSVDHGTALDLAGTGGAHAGSLREAIALAVELAR